MNRGRTSCSQPRFVRLIPSLLVTEVHVPSGKVGVSNGACVAFRAAEAGADLHMPELTNSCEQEDLSGPRLVAAPRVGNRAGPAVQAGQGAGPGRFPDDDERPFSHSLVLPANRAGAAHRWKERCRAARPTGAA
ncbi:hypothetical protein GCM10010271_07010 [Streptomyces kurssanovii]|nr:hypothetical protein GCM10010271_07010 [Streptomyces kurssanovii]